MTAFAHGPNNFLQAGWAGSKWINHHGLPRSMCIAERIKMDVEYTAPCIQKNRNPKEHGGNAVRHVRWITAWIYGRMKDMQVLMSNQILLGILKVKSETLN
ncbi:hypothetical protein SETIT_2G416000v2 [Setaria italica]|uniref:Uncharacterized protein n=2 Tax=Setaria TaxID=4554 RepID=A0A368QAN5_SETIT|nr:hypothetical protein SETIT_2G416000v2 [Setaria italica]TKW36247.1 hypothetical protein SEVIR_2G428000v2 [Setaria viridis]